MAQTRHRLTLSAAIFVAGSVLLGATPAGTSPIRDKERAARALEQQLQAQGDRLSRATEAFDQAQLRRGTLDRDLKRATGHLRTTEAHLATARHDFGRFARLLYMHPGGWLTELLDAQTIGDLERAHVLAAKAAGTADDALLAARRSRAQLRDAAARVRVVRDAARRNEQKLMSEERAAQDAFKSTQGLLSRTRGELGALLEADRQARLRSASALAAANGLKLGPVRPSAATAVRAAASQIGKPYRWGAGGPGSYDCSGLTSYAWGTAGVSLPHSSRAQYASLPHVPLSQLQPGDLIFFGSPIHHVGIYAGGGRMIHAPQTGETVREESIYAMRPVGAARP